MDKSRDLERKMRNLAHIGQEFYSSLQQARSSGAPSEMIADADRLLELLSGGPNAGALQSMNDAERDVIATREFVEKWKDRATPLGTGLHSTATRTLRALTEFRDTVAALTPSERRDVERTAAIGRTAMGRLPIWLVVVVIVMIAALIYVGSTVS